MSNTETTTNPTVDDIRFPSLSSLRVAHSELLKLHREQGNQADVLTQIEQFMLKGRATGAVLDSEDDRWAAQGILDYWSSLLYRAGQEPPDTTLVDFDPSLAPDLSDDRCPYMGLEAFREQNQQLFFGRQRLVERLLSHLTTNRLLVVVGSSGSGKSSVVLGGLLPRLKAGALPDSQDWIYYEPLVPGSAPLGVLAQRLQPPESVPTTWITQQVAAFKQNPNHLVQLLQPEKHPAVLVIDQFEEVFTLCQDDEVRQAFISNLLNFVQTPEAQHVLILTMRTDFESYVARIPRLWEHFEQSAVRVFPLDASELREAIEKPAELVGLKFDAGLVDKLLNDVLGEPAALPLLQFTLLKLWDHREHNRIVWDAYQRLGGGRSALSNSANEFYNHLIPEEQLTVKRILLQMVRPGEGLEVTSNRIPRKELYRKGEAIDRVDRVLDKLVAARLVRLTDSDVPENAQVEVAHEALIRNWSRLVDWLEDERVTLRQRLDLRRKAERWQAQGKDRSWLLRGSALQEALGYEDLNDLETRFVRSSRQDEQRRKFLSQLTTGLIIALSMSVAVVSGGAAWFADRARKNTEIQSLSLSANNLWLSQLQIEALTKALSAVQQSEDYGKVIEPEIKLQAKVTLQQILYQIREHNRLGGQQDIVRAVQFSPDGGTLAVASDDGTVKLGERDGKPITTLQAHQDTVTAIQFSPDGQTLASASSDQTIKLWSRTGEPIATLQGHQGKVRAVQFSPDGQRLASASDDQTVRLWTGDGKPIKPLEGHQGNVGAVQFSPDGQVLASAGDDKTVRLWTRDGELAATLPGHQDAVRAVQFSPDGKILASASNDKTVKLWSRTGELIATLSGHQEGVSAVQFSRDGQTLASASLDNTIKLWSRTGELVATLQGHQGPVQAVRFSPDGQTLASASFDKTVKLWSHTGELVATLQGHQDPVLDVQYSPDGQTLASVGLDRTVKLWGVHNNHQKIVVLQGNQSEVKGQQEEVSKMQFSPDGQTLASASPDKTVKLWTRDGKLTNTLQGHQGVIQAMQFSLDSQILATAGFDGIAKLWTRDGKPIATLPGHKNLIWTVQFSSDSQTLATASFDGTAKLWTQDGNLIATLQGHQGQVSDVEFSPDSNTIATASLDKTVKLWTHDGKLLDTLAGHQGRVWVVQFSPDGKILASAGEDKTVRLWSRDGKPIQTLAGHQGLVWAVQFSRDGQTLASISQDRTVKLWSRTGKLIATLQGHQGSVLDVQFSPDGKFLVSNSKDGTVKLWRRDGELLGTLQGHEGPVWSVKYLSPETLISASADNTIRLWELNSDPLKQTSCDWLNSYFAINPDANHRVHDQAAKLCP
ncbi:AAA family ATPase [Leptolyngbya sp. NK1-12]|uniref:AAA family ATPase n=1 Tax=Leptolyngbya sp. NK1-12 TaxID=2547451 RepID=A0AA96WN83_9CYAN|nr:AAA family ATPase [Leptolyngbya sp. NK1-12]